MKNNYREIIMAAASKATLVEAAKANGLDTKGKTKEELIKLLSNALETQAQQEAKMPATVAKVINTTGVNNKKEETVMKTAKSVAPATTKAPVNPTAHIEVKKIVATTTANVEYVRLHSKAKEVCAKKYGMTKKMLEDDEWKAFSNLVNEEMAKRYNKCYTVLYKVAMEIKDKGTWALVTLQNKQSKAQRNGLYYYKVEKKDDGSVTRTIGEKCMWVTM